MKYQSTVVVAPVLVTILVFPAMPPTSTNRLLPASVMTRPRINTAVRCSLSFCLSIKRKASAAIVANLVIVLPN